MALTFNSLTEKVKQMLGGVRQQAPQTLSNIGNAALDAVNPNIRPAMKSAQILKQNVQAIPRLMPQFQQNARANPIPMKAFEGLAEATTLGIKDINYRPSQNIGEKLAYGTGYTLGMLNPVGPFQLAARGLKATKLLSGTQQALGSKAGQLIARGGGKALLGRGVANMSQGLPYTAAYSLLRTAGGKGEITDAPMDLAFDFGLGAIPVVGALAIGARRGQRGFDKKVISEAKDILGNEARQSIGRFAQIVETSPSANRKNLGNLGDEIQSMAETLWGEKAKHLSNKQLKNAFDVLLYQLDNTKGYNRDAAFGLSTQNVRDAMDGKVPTQPRTPTDPLKALKERKLVTSVKEAPNIIEGVKAETVGTYTPKANKRLMAEAEALLQEGASIDFRNTKDLDKKVAATIQEAINQQQKGNPQAAANLFNNLAEQATELGRGVQAFSLLEKMSPQAIALSAAGRIKKYNRTALRKIPELSGEQIKMISDQVAKIDGLTGREKNIAIYQLQDTINNFIPSTLADKAITVWKAGLLTSLRTHERNLLGNTIMSLSENIKDAPASLADRIMSMSTGKRTLTLTNKGTLKGVKRGTQAAKDIIKTGFDPEEAIAKMDIKRITWGNNPLEQALKKYTDLVFRTLGAEDKVTWHAAFSRSLYDQAGAAAINAGKQGNPRYIEKLVEKPSAQMLEVATNDANTVTFKDKNALTQIATAVKRAAQNPRLGWGSEMGKILTEVLMPFTGVPSSIVGKTIAYSPVGLLKGALNMGRVMLGQVPELQRQAAQEVGRGVLGTGLFALGSYLMSRGLMTGQPKDAKEAEQWKMEGKQANSVLIDGKWRSINSIGPQFLVVLAGQKYQEEMSNPEGGVGGLLAGFAKDQLSQTFLQGVQGPLQAVNEPDRYAKSYIGNQGASVIPNIVKDLAKSTDALSRETNTIQDYFKANIPGVRMSLPPKRDVIGTAIKQEPSGLGAFVDLFNSKTPISNMVVDELSRLNTAGYSATPSKLSKNQTIQKQKVVLNPQQLDTFEAGVGSMIVERLDSLFSTQSYKSMSDEEKSATVDKIVRQTRIDFKDLYGADILRNAMPYDVSFQDTDDMPQNILDKVALAAQGITKDPGNTIKAIFTQEELRKIEGNAVILKRQEFLNKFNDPDLQRDHIIPLGLGGDNSESNLMYVPKDYHKAKTRLDQKLIRQLQSGEITRQEAQRQVKEWVNANPAKHFVLEGGNIEEFDSKINIPEYPKMTGLTEVDKKLKSSYYSKLTAVKNKAQKLYESGEITAEEFEKILTSVNSKKTSTGSAKARKPPTIKVKKLSVPRVPTIKIRKFTPPKINIKRKKLTLKNKSNTMRIKV